MAIAFVLQQLQEKFKGSALHLLEAYFAGTSHRIVITFVFPSNIKNMINAMVSIVDELQALTENDYPLFLCVDISRGVTIGTMLWDSFQDLQFSSNANTEELYEYLKSSSAHWSIAKTILKEAGYEQ